MKTTKIFSAISLALILSASTLAVFAGIGGKGDNTKPSITPVVNHHVTISISDEKKICNTYLVEILNASGQLVAPAKTYVPGVTKYDFYERGPVSGVRIAVLVLAPAYSHFACETELFTAPVMIKGTFSPGQTYRYDLFPKSQINRE